MLKASYAFVSLLTAVTTIFLGVFVYSQGHKKKLNALYSFWALSVGLWSFSLVLNVFAPTQTYALIASKILHVGAIILPAIYVHFVLVYLGKESERLHLIRFLYSVMVIFLILNFTPWLSTVRYLSKFNFFVTAPQILYPLHIAIFILSIVYVYAELVASLLISEGERKKQIIVFLIASIVGYSGGITNYLINYGILLFPLYPFGNITCLFYVAMIGVSFIKYRFMDINVIIRRTVVFAGLLAFVFGIFSMATIFVQELLVYLGAGKLATYAISLFFIVLGYDPIRNFLINITDKYLFQKRYDYQKLLKDASRGMSKIESLHHLLGLVIHFITMKMRVKNAAVMMRRRDNEFELGYQRGFDKNFLEYHLDDTNPMIMYLKQEKEAIDMDRIQEFMQAGNKKKVKGDRPHEYDFQAIMLTMRELNSACAVPSFLGRELRNILLLGEKKSGEFYTQDDLNILFTLAQESAIAIENAKLYDEAISKSAQLEKINEQLEYSRNLLMKALRETEVANKQLQDTQAQLIHEQKMATLGRLAASVGHEVNNPLTILSMNVSRAILKYRKNPDLRVGEVLELFQKMEQNIGRIKAVVNTLTGLLKRSEKGKFEPLSLKLILEETLPLVQFQTYLDNLTGTEVEFDIPGSTPLIRGDLERLQEVFLNLFINAYHAMTGRRNRRIRVTAEMDSENTHNVAIHFTDNGSGMTEEVMKKIFNYGFTTKPPGKGSGMGLYMCKYIIELHGGDIRVRSKLGEGTTFTITLPAYEEQAGEANIQVELSS